ncbi:allophanate hydrolase subunit 1 [Arthrobacter sp. I2-34]|uniref:Allophanate hydrolase subunit 1 n=1 Tax=Arthrobacter hankyongi TaxID=2904801 RepID=A0ABS9LC60_9MICC|nr:allophanate hydrolase subunit 1 [Arthrobacter hankyongi]MCG2624274.1 allophanate hydrolase subunit 1 [Arthrobacter hankyongi]
MRILPFGDGALLAEFGSLAEVLAHYRPLAAASLPGVVDLVPAARTILATFDASVSAAEVRRWLQAAAPVDDGAAVGAEITIEVDYSGEDLAEVARLLKVDEREVVRRHTGSRWTAAFTGFAPGFAYLVAPGDPLRVPRREVPRTRVPAGSVGLAGEFSGIYPGASPGGWQLIGRTEARLWDTAREEPALIRPGAVVRFREAR